MIIRFNSSLKIEKDIETEEKVESMMKGALHTYQEMGTLITLLHHIENPAFAKYLTDFLEQNGYSIQFCKVTPLEFTNDINVDKIEVFFGVMTALLPQYPRQIMNYLAGCF